MKRLFLILSFFALLSTHAVEVESFVPRLAGDDYSERQNARNELQQAVFAATAPGADPAEAQALEAGILDVLASDAPEDAKFFLLQALPFIATQQSAMPVYRLTQGDNERLAQTAQLALAAMPAETKAPLREISSVAIAGPQAVNPLAGASPATLREQALNSPNPAVSALAFQRYLNAASLVDSVNLIEAVFNNPAVSGRTQIIRLATLSDQRPVSGFILARLQSLDPEDQRTVLGAIADGALRAQESRVLALAQGQHSPTIDNAIFETLGVIGTEESLPYLMQTYRTQSGDTRQLIAETIAGIPSPALDANLMQAVRRPGDSRVDIIELLAVRFPEGTVDTFNALLSADLTPQEQEALVKALETLGNRETVAALVDRVLALHGSPAQRPTQLALKRIASGLNQPEALWNEIFRPAIQNATSAEAADLVIILDCVSCEPVLEYVQTQIVSGDPTLSRAALGALMRWPTVDGARAWLEIAQDPNAGDALKTRAWNGVYRAISSDNVKGPFSEKAEAAAAAYTASGDPEYRAKILAEFEGLTRWNEKRQTRDAFDPLKEDPEVAAMLSTL